MKKQRMRTKCGFKKFNAEIVYLDLIKWERNNKEIDILKKNNYKFVGFEGGRAKYVIDKFKNLR